MPKPLTATRIQTTVTIGSHFLLVACISNFNLIGNASPRTCAAGFTFRCSTSNSYPVRTDIQRRACGRCPTSVYGFTTVPLSSLALCFQSKYKYVFAPFRLFMSHNGKCPNQARVILRVQFAGRGRKEKKSPNLGIRDLCST